MKTTKKQSLRYNDTNKFAKDAVGMLKMLNVLTNAKKQK